MVNEYLFHMLAGSIMLLFLAGYAGIFFFDKKQKVAGWMTLTFLLGIGAQVLNGARTGFGNDWQGVGGLLLFWAANTCVVMAYAAYTRELAPKRSLVAAWVFGLLMCFPLFQMQVESIPRIVLIELTTAWIISSSIPMLRGKNDFFIDRLLLAFNFAVIGVYILRVAILVIGVHPAVWTNVIEFYDSILILTSIILGMVGACLILIAMGVDIVAKAQREAVTDSLTGINNRRGMNEVVRTAEDSEEGSPLTGRAVLIFDIDHFKKVNDEFGHDSGDEVLAKIGSTIRQLMRYHGDAARTGGEEFMFLFNKESTNAAFLVAEHLRVAIGMLVHSGLDPERRVTVSMGLAFVRDGEPLKRASRRADNALYEAKDAGRNRLRLAEGDTLPEIEETIPIPLQRSAQHLPEIDPDISDQI